MMRYVQYGCSYTGGPAQWENFDASVTLKIERIPLLGRLYTKNPQRFPPNVKPGDIVKGLPVPEGSCRGVYASHVLEHLALEDFHAALDNTKRLLGPDGIFRVVVPDLEWAAREYVRRLEAGDTQANALFLQATGLGAIRRGRGVFGLVHKWLNTSEHLWMWDAESLAHALRQHGFAGIRRCGFGDCLDPMFALVESQARFEHAVALEARC